MKCCHILGWSTFTKKDSIRRIASTTSKDPGNCPKENVFSLCNEGWMWLVFTTTFRHKFTYKWNITYLDLFKVIVYLYHGKSASNNHLGEYFLPFSKHHLMQIQAYKWKLVPRSQADVFFFRFPSI